jgi:hypothetical protein
MLVGLQKVTVSFCGFCSTIHCEKITPLTPAKFLHHKVNNVTPGLAVGPNGFIDKEGGTYLKGIRKT